MRIQHNIMAMNAYRNYNTNTKALSGNLEKLSSGYKINRAGDDAAGLAISEKMRAQITGLDAAQKNVKDGISLVKTAEGAMQEIQDMLNRMDYLATQSANGTYQNEVDRENLQKEVNNLKTEINRIADSANFNGIKLLDGSLDSGASKPADTLLKTLAKDADGKYMDVDEIKATQGQYVTTKIENPETVDLSAGDTFKLTLGLKDENGNEYTKEIILKAESTSTAGEFNLVDADGNKFGKNTTTTGKIDKADLATAFKKALANDAEFSSTFKIEGDETAGLKFTNYAMGASTEITSANISCKMEKAASATKVTNTTDGWQDLQVSLSKKDGDIIIGQDKSYSFDLSNAPVWDGTERGLEAAVMELDGHKFVFVQNDDDIPLSREMQDVLQKNGVEQWVQLSTAGGNIVADDVKAMAQEMRLATGLDVRQGENAGSEWKAGEGANAKSIRIMNDKNGKGASGNGGLTLQIGDTSDKFNQMKVAIGDMHTNAMGKGKTTLDGKEVTVNKTVADIDIGTQEGAQEAVAVIKNAINYVSSVRGDLGAVQNRLEHTGNNLSVMAENIQDAESTIRDTDVANEMMSYVKNNILVQSAQAMLAQANQVPQGVLQLLG